MAAPSMRTGSPSISVVIPARNRAATLGYCLDSVLAQTLAAQEVIVVDDGSSDDTGAVLQRYAGRGVVHHRLQSGRGAQAARNAGIRVARGEWIAFQDSDDIWMPEKLALQVQALQAAGGGSDLVAHGNGLKRQGLAGPTTPLLVPTTAGDCHTVLLSRPGPLFPTILASKAALLACGGLDEACPAYQEWDTALRLSRRASFVHVQQPLFVWVWHRNDTISKDAARAVAGYNYILDRYRDEIVAVHGARLWRRLKLQQTEVALRAGLWQPARAHLSQAGAHPTIVAARFLAGFRLAPRGLGRVLGWFA